MTENPDYVCFISAVCIFSTDLHTHVNNNITDRSISTMICDAADFRCQLVTYTPLTT